MKSLVESIFAGETINDTDKDAIAALDEFYLSMTDEQKAETGELVSPEKLDEAVNVIVEYQNDSADSDADVELDESLIGTRVSGEVLVSFTAPKSAVEGKQTVVFEELYGESGVTGEFIIVGDHKDINDEGQTVYYPEIKTLAHSDDPNSPHNAQIDFATNMVKFTDTITYKNLMPGEKYRAEGVLMDKQAGTELIDGNTNNKITASTEFVPESPDGTVDVVFEFDASNIGIDYSSTNIADTIKQTVVFEDVYLVGNGVADDIIIGKHADLNDEDQSMLVGNFLADELIETGGEILPLGDAGFIVAALIAINAGLYAYWMRFRRKEDLA